MKAALSSLLATLRLHGCTADAAAQARVRVRVCVCVCVCVCDRYMAPGQMLQLKRAITPLSDVYRSVPTP